VHENRGGFEMIKYFDSIDLAFIGKSFIKKDLFYELIKRDNINLKKKHIIGIDDKLGVLKIIKELKEKGFSATGFWINRQDFEKYDKKYYDYEISTLKSVVKFLKEKKIKNALIIADFDNTLAKAAYEAVKRSKKEDNFWDKMPKNFFTSALSMMLSPFTYATIILDLFIPSNINYRDAKEFKNYLEKKGIDCWVISYRSKYLQKKYF
jgi:hypothetical protein